MVHAVGPPGDFPAAKTTLETHTDMKFLTAGFRREDLLRIAPEDLPHLAGEVRERIIETVRENGGQWS